MDLPGDRPRHLAEQVQDVPQVAVVVLGPEVLVIISPDQLGGDSHPAFDPQDRAFHNSVHIELACNLRDRLVGVPVKHSRGPRDDV